MAAPNVGGWGTVRDYGAQGDGRADDGPAFGAMTAALTAAGGGTLRAGDGVYGLRRTLELPAGVSLEMSPGAVLRALEGFEGEALVQTRPGETYEDQSIRGGTLDAACQPLVGLRICKGRRVLVAELLVRDALAKGIHVGSEGHYEVNLSDVRCRVREGVRAAAGSIGVHYDRCGDSLVRGVVVIGYETCFRSDSSSNDFQQVHVWNHKDNCPLVTCFHCNGWNDSYVQCYADSPINGGEEGYGFLVTRPFNRIMACRVYCNAYATPGTVVGVQIAPGGTHGTYLGNHFMAREGHEMKLAFGGTLEGAYVAGNSYTPTVLGGKVDQQAGPRYGGNA